MMKRSDWIWTVIGLAAVVFSCYLLYKEIRTISWTSCRTVSTPSVCTTG